MKRSTKRPTSTPPRALGGVRRAGLIHLGRLGGLLGRLGGLGLLGVLGLHACGGGSGGESISLAAISVQAGDTWPLNRPIDFTFSAPVDFASVSSSSISIRQRNGTPAVGSFRLLSPNVVRFQPRCPLLPDYSDAGLQPSPAQGNATTYTILVQGGANNSTVTSIGGGRIEQSQPVEFQTPPIDASPSVIFIDSALGGPQPLVRGVNAPADALAACRLELGGDPSNVVYFQDLGGGQVGLAGGFLVPLNLYSVADQQVTVIVELNQAVSPLPSNLTDDRVRLQYEETSGAGDWQEIAADLELVANCTATGATVRLVPRGILPQARNVRLFIAAEFQDIVGSINPTAITALPMTTRVVDFSAIDPLQPSEWADEIFEDFLIGSPLPGSLEDGSAASTEARAIWGGGKLLAGFPFDGTGGPGGTFDLHIPLSSETVFNTTSTTFLGGPDGLITASQTAVNGRLDVRNLVVPEGATLIIEGPNPALILATGEVRVFGRILATGSGNPGVNTLNTANFPETGAAGQAGGGRGGDGSPLTSQHSPRGQRGFGAFDVPGGGGEGGEAAYASNPAADTVDNRRGSGGGGGAFGADVIDPQPLAPCTTAVARPDNNIIGLDAERGFPGASNSFGALNPGVRAAGGLPGPRPFFDANPNNDFFGQMITPTGDVITGELLQPHAGAGGGGGGDAIQGASFPGTFGPAAAEKAAGAGGGGGSLRIQALGDIVLGPRGLISVAGGVGGGGENTNGVNRVGGGSGGGSGGHLILESAGRVDLSAVIGTLPFSSNSAPDVGLLAPGGQGGAGGGNIGGSGAQQAVPTPVCRDSVAENSCPIQNGTAPVVGAGGDGGPGIIQIHVSSLSDIIPPATGVGSLFNRGQRALPANVFCGNAGNFQIIKNNAVIKPPPVGAPLQVKTANNTVGWSQLVPSFGQLSRAQSVWIPLGEAGARPGGMAAEAVDFFFGGTTLPDGFVQTVGDQVAELPQALGTALGSGAVITLTNQNRTAVVSATGLTDDAYKRNPALLRGFLLRILPLGGGAPRNFDVAAANYDLALDQFSLTVQGTGQPLAGLQGADFELRPRFFRVSTDGVLDRLPASATVRIEFQATRATLSGVPDESVGAPSAWTPDIGTLNGNLDWKFVRFRVRFDIQADGVTPLNSSTPKPAVEFLRVPFRF